jgi:hypothetical protein
MGMRGSDLRGFGDAELANLKIEILYRDRFAFASLTQHLSC